MTRNRMLLSLIGFTVVVYAASRLLAGANGLNAFYFSGPDWQGPATSYVDSPPSTTLLKARRPDFAARSFSVEWRGFVAVTAAGRYTFRTISDDGSWVYVRGTQIVSNGGRHGPVAAEGSITLQPGIHSIFVKYFQDTEDCVFQLWWSRDGRPFELVPPWALVTDRVSYGRIVAERAGGVTLTALAIAWYLLIAGGAVRLLVRAWRTLDVRLEPDQRALRWVLLLSALLNLWGITWSMPNTRGWAPDEVVPSDVLGSFESSFSHGWHDKYPPFQYMVLAAADSPILVLSQLGLVDVRGAAANVALVMIGRTLSVLLASATLVVVYRCARELYGSRGAVLAALTVALTVPFAYYSKLANLDIPYLFWFSISLLAYVRILKRHAPGDYVLFTMSAALAGCTKDQIWGAYVFTPVAILIARWQLARQAGAPVQSVLFDRTVSVAIAAGLLTFALADNVIFNLSGFVSHVRVLLGTPGAFQAFPRTAGGQLQMAGRAIVEMRYMFGWPLAVMAVAALGAALRGTNTTPSLHWLLVPALSYYAAFVGVILFFFDRYFFPLTFVIALYVGWWLDRFLAPGAPGRRARIAAVAAAFLYSVFYVAAVNYAMSADSRYAVSAWLRERVGANDVIGSLGPIEYQTIADRFTWESVESVEDVARLQPAYVVLNADQMQYLSPRIQLMHASLRDGRAGYQLAKTFHSSMPPLPGLHPDLGPAARHGPEYSDLGMINPTMEVFVRKDLAR